METRESLPHQKTERDLLPKAKHGRDLAIEYKATALLKLDAKNPRVHSDKQVEQIARSIGTFGFNVPVLIDANLHVIAGHGRLAAAGLMNLDRVPTICLEHLNDAQRRAFAIADNRLTENSEWDNELLRDQFKILSEAELDFSLEVTGFQMTEIDLLIENLGSAEPPANDPADAIPDSLPLIVTKTGDIWQLGRHKVICGDALFRPNYKLLLGNHKANVVFTDPPYNVRIAGNVSGNGKKCHREFSMASGEMNEDEFTEFLDTSLKNAAAYSASGSLHYVCMDWRHVKELLTAGNATYSELKNVCVWVKNNAGMGSFYRSQHEFVFVFKLGAKTHRNKVQLGQFGRSRTNVWNYPGANTFSRTSKEGNLLALHPTVKPVALVADAILDCSARGDIVLDPFLGSGTTLIAAERTGRTCYGFEIDPSYVDIAVRRWQKFTMLDAIHQASGENFNQCQEAAFNAQSQSRVRQTAKGASVPERRVRQSKGAAKRTSEFSDGSAARVAGEGRRQ